MNFCLKLNETILKEGEFKTLNALFNDLSGLSFAKGKSSSWLDKMSARESYETYLKIKAKEYGLTSWEGTLMLCSRDQQAERVHLFDTHAISKQNTDPLKKTH